MAEKHRFQAPRLCANNCGFFGSPATQNLCSKCFRDLQLKQQQSSSAKHALNQTLASTTAAISAASSYAAPPSISVVVPKEVGESKPEETAAVGDQRRPLQEPNRCSTCRRRVGLTGFNCRCGLLCCGAHRYPEQHGCSFDFKGMGKEQIAKANPVVKADKLEKI